MNERFDITIQAAWIHLPTDVVLTLNNPSLTCACIQAFRFQVLSANAGTHFQRPREQQPCLAFFGVGVWSSIRLGGQPISSRQC